MKKTISISIAHTLFNIEEDAYAKLELYLRSIKEHFAANPDNEEIVGDIESRIAERLSELPHKIITLADVERITADMGTINQFDETEAHEEKTHSSKKGHRKQLYRDPDGAVIAGVASGLSYYTGVSADVMRLIFVIAAFIHGIGIPVYIVLWFLLPEATTPSQKLEMRGDPVTLSNMSSMVKEKIDSIDMNSGKSTRKKILSIPGKVLREIVNLIQNGIFPAFRVIIGSMLAVSGFGLAVGGTILAGILLFSAPIAFMPIGMGEMMNGTLFYVALAGSYIAGLIPCILIFFLGLGLLNKKTFLSTKIILALLALFFAGLVVSGITISRLSVSIGERLQTNPNYAQTSRVLALDEFSTLSVSDGFNVTYVPGTEYSATISGRGYDIDHISAQVSDKTLSIKNVPFDHRCLLFCWHTPLSITVTSPTLSGITVHDGVSLRGSLTTRGPLSLTSTDGSDIDMTISANTLNATLSDGSHVTLSGTITTETISAKDGSHFDGKDLQASQATITARDGANIEVSASQTLNVTGSDGSSIQYQGEPQITKNLSDGSSLQAL